MTTDTATTTQVHQLYIRATPEQIWEGITKPEFIERYFFGLRAEGTYEVGTTVKSWSPDRSRLWTDNTVLECVPPRRLVHTWLSLYDPELAAEEPSRVSWEIEPQGGGYTKLTVRPRPARRRAAHRRARLGRLDARPQRPEDPARDR